MVSANSPVAASSSTAPPSRGKRWWSVPDIRWTAVLIVLTLALYVQVIGFEFINFDDDVHVYENPYVRAGLSWTGFIWAFQIHGPSQWHPLAWISHEFDWQCFGKHPAGHHAMNLAFHVCGVVLLFYAMKSLLGRPGLAAFIAALFAVHPLNIESVAWVSERRNVLCGMFWMLALIAYCRYARQGGPVRYAWVTCCLALALLSKPLAVTLPCVFALLDYWPLRRCPLPTAWQPSSGGSLSEACPTQSWSMLVMEKVPWFLLCAGAGWLSYLCQEQIHVVSDLQTLPLQLRLENACVAYGLYLRRTVWPADLAVFYPHPAWRHPHPEQDLLAPALYSGAMLLGVTLFAVWNIRRWPSLAVGWFWFLGTLVPMIGLVQVGQQQLADRYAYIPMIGLGLMVAALPTSLPATRFLPRLASLLVVYWFSFSVWQLGFWQNSKVLFTHTAAITTDNSWARLNLGLALLAEGKYAEGIENYQMALTIDPKYALAHYNLGVAWSDLGRLDLALPHFERAVALNDRDVNAWIRLGGATGHAGDLAHAERCFRQAIAIDDRSAQAWFNLGLVLQARGTAAEGLDLLKQSVELEPENLHFRTNLMQSLAQSGNLPEARAQAQEILRRDPRSDAARKLLSAIPPSEERETDPH